MEFLIGLDHLAMDFVVVSCIDEGNVCIIHKNWFLNEEEDACWWPPARDSRNQLNDERKLAIKGVAPGDGWSGSLFSGKQVSLY